MSRAVDDCRSHDADHFRTKFVLDVDSCKRTLPCRHHYIRRATTPSVPQRSEYIAYCSALFLEVADRYRCFEYCSWLQLVPGVFFETTSHTFTGASWCSRVLPMFSVTHRDGRKGLPAGNKTSFQRTLASVHACPVSSLRTLKFTGARHARAPCASVVRQYAPYGIDTTTSFDTSIQLSYIRSTARKHSLRFAYRDNVYMTRGSSSQGNRFGEPGVGRHDLLKITYGVNIYVKCDR
jgi:hypothetical protein